MEREELLLNFKLTVAEIQIKKAQIGKLEAEIKILEAEADKISQHKLIK